jgi:N-acetylmuramoyl-L-alanine amidase
MMAYRWIFVVVVWLAAVSPALAADTYADAVQDFQALSQDAVRANRRDLWIALSERFRRLGESAPSADERVKALWYAARAWEEIARRSHLAMDARRAADAYGQVVSRAPTHRLADDAALNQALLLAKVGDVGAARSVLEHLIVQFPQGDMVPQARRELARLGGTAPKTSPPTFSSKAASSSSSKGGPSAKSSPRSVTKKQKKQAGSLVEQLGLTVRTVVIDAGHGGKDPGAMAHGLREKDINLRMARILGPLLEDHGFRVVYTRTKDAYLSLDKRTRLANAAKGDLFLSIHCNAHTDTSVQGFELYYLDLATDKQAIRVAARENGVSEKKISDMQLILSDLLLHSKIDESKTLARVVQKQVMSLAGRKFGLQDHGARGAFFYVLTGVRMPAVLVELGYITHAEEARRLASDAYLRTMAQSLAQGVVAYTKQLERFAQGKTGGGS